MTPLPTLLGAAAELVAWRLDNASHAPTWDSGRGAFLNGGRWSSKGVSAVYCALDPAAAVLEVAVHKTFGILNTVPYV
jgi:RES domain-containing protein